MAQAHGFRIAFISLRGSKDSSMGTVCYRGRIGACLDYHLNSRFTRALLFAASFRDNTIEDGHAQYVIIRCARAVALCALPLFLRLAGRIIHYAVDAHLMGIATGRSITPPLPLAFRCVRDADYVILVFCHMLLLLYRRFHLSGSHAGGF